MEKGGRYTRLSQLGWSLDILRGMRCLVVGAGALGNEVIKNLALLGVTSITIIDMDIIENSNLTRSVLFHESEIGLGKAKVAAKKAMEIDSNVKAVALTGEFQHLIGLGGFYDFDVVFGCLDSIQARIDLSKNCMQANVLYIDGGLRGIDGDVKIFGDGYSVCFDCLLTKAIRNEAWRRFSCLKLRADDADKPIGPTAPTISSIIAGLQVQFAVKYFHRLEIPLNHRISVHGNLNEFSVVKLSRSESCPTHYRYSPIAAEQLIPLPLTAVRSTGRELYDAVSHDFGDKATIEMEFDLITEARCKTHAFSRELMKRRGTLYASEMICPECKANGKQDIEAMMTELVFNQITGEEPFLDATLQKIGFSPRSVIKAFRIENDDIINRYYLLQDKIAEVS